MTKNKILIFRIFLIIVFALMGFGISGNVIYDYEEGVLTFDPEDASYVKGYEIYENNLYKMASDDPQIVFDLLKAPVKLKEIKITLETPARQDIPVQVFFRERFNRYAEETSVKTMFMQGQTELVCSFDSEKCSFLRLDMDGDFQYKNMEVSGLMGNMNPFKTAGYYCCLVIFLLCIWRFVSERLGTVFFQLVKKIWEGYGFLYNKVEGFALKKGLHIGHVFCVIALCYGLSMAFLVPPDQVPDELTHYYQMVEFAGFPQIEKQIEDFFYKTGVGDMQGNPLVQVDQARLAEHMNDHFDKTVVNYTGFSTSIIKHLPATITFFIGYFLDLPVYQCLMMAEIGALLFYVVMGYLTLKYMPFKKELMCGILLLPMTVQQCASVNYDSMLISVSLFLTAYIFHCKYEKEWTGWKDLLLFFIIAYVVMKMKPVYAPIFLQVLLIPFSKWKLKIGKRFDVLQLIKKLKWVILPVGILMCAGVLYIGRNNTYVQLVEACFLRPDLVMVRLFRTIKELGGFYVMSMIADLGWLDTLMPEGFYLFVIICLFIFGQQNRSRLTGQSYEIKWKEKLLIIFISLTTLYLIFVAMFTWTMFLYDIDSGGTLSGMIDGIKKISLSLGVQGRYFLPVAFLFFIPFDRLFKVEKKTLFLIQCIYYPVIIFMSLWVLLQRYWI